MATRRSRECSAVRAPVWTGLELTHESIAAVTTDAAPARTSQRLLRFPPATTHRPAAGAAPAARVWRGAALPRTEIEGRGAAGPAGPPPPRGRPGAAHHCVCD